MHIVSRKEYDLFRVTMNLILFRETGVLDRELNLASIPYMGSPSLLHLGWCTLCQQEKGECDVCSVPITLTTNPGAGGAKSYAQRSQAKGIKGAEVFSVNMHRLGESFGKVSGINCYN